MQQQSLPGKTLIEKLTGDFEIMFDFKDTCTKLPYFSYPKNVELRVLAKEMISLDPLAIDQWKTIENYGKRKYRLR